MSRAFPRRTVLAAIGVGLPALAVVGACGSAATPPAADVLLHTDWTARPGGTRPTVGDDGVPFRLQQLGEVPPPPPSVVRGALEGMLPDGRSGSSVAAPLRDRVRRLGATFTFTAGAPSGALVLAAWTGFPFVNAACHLVVTPAQWSLGVVEDQAVRVVRGEDHPVRLPQDGVTPTTVDVSLAGETATLLLPDGTVGTVTDPAIGRVLGTMPAWEFYKDAPGAADVRLFRTWAG